MLSQSSIATLFYSRMKYLGLLLKFFWFTICAIGNLFQIGEITDQFFKYEIVTTINVNFPDTFTAPAISSCFYQVELVDWSKLLGLKPRIKEQINMSSSSIEEIIEEIHTMSLFKKRVIEGIVFQGMDIEARLEVMIAFDELFQECSLTDPKDVLKTK